MKMMRGRTLETADNLEFARGLPASLDAERTILGTVLLDNEAFFDEVADLRVTDFSGAAHQHIFATMTEIMFGMVEGVDHVDLVTLAETLARRKKIGAVGGVAYLSSLTEGLPRNLSPREYVRIVRDKAQLRQVIKISSEAIRRSADQSESAAKIRSDLQELLIEEESEGEEAAVRIGTIAPEVEKSIEGGRNLDATRAAAQLTWGIEELDVFTRGAFYGEMTIVAGESGGYKTALATQMILANAIEQTPCAFFSMEMKKEQLTRRFYPQMSRIVTANHIRDPRLINLHTHVPEIRRISQELSKLPIWIDDTSPLQVNRLIARMRMMIRKHKIRLFVVDYLQLLVPNPARTEVEAMKGAIFQLRDFLKSEPSCHLVLLSQYSKQDGTQKRGKRSRSDLYGGSALHQAAQNVLLIKVESAYDKADNELLEVEIDVNKQREGKRGPVTSMLDRDHLRIAKAQPPLRG